MAKFKKPLNFFDSASANRASSTGVTAYQANHCPEDPVF